MTIRILSSGLLTTIQDGGRHGRLHMALSRAGAMDPHALALANCLVGNAPNDAGLEFTGSGPTLFFERETCVAITGGVMPARMTAKGESTSVDLPSHRPVRIAAGTTVRWAACTSGFRVWLAIAGGIDSDCVLDSRSSHLAAEIGPSRLQKDDVLSVGTESERAVQIRQALARAGLISPRWAVPSSIASTWPVLEIAAIEGRHFNMLSAEDRKRLFDQAWIVSTRSNRQGLSLEGTPLKAPTAQLASEPVREGTVQLPPSGEPIILLAEHQSTGGYPRVLEVPLCMREHLAQAGPPARVVFRLIRLEEADLLARKAKESSDRLQESIESKLCAL